MAITRKEEERALNADELTLVDKSRHPALQALPDTDLKSLVKLLRERREKAKTQAHQRRREIRGKTAPKGNTASKADDGSKTKLSVLAMAMRRTNAEIERRRQMAAKQNLVENAQHALKLKQQADADKVPFNTRHAHEGMRHIPNKKAENLINPMERGRQKKAAGVAQAKRDHRQTASS
ncbi:MAG: hypothetical protein LBI75_11675 [Brucellaceae bacterium]|nr:hypothetical protein [Brucellaceae bacterium]